METYKNLGQNSNVLSYELASNSITIQFRDYSKYIYSYKSAGQLHVEEMKRLARQGQGLNSYIMRNAKYNYET